MEPDHPETGFPLLVATEGYSHHTHQLSPQETNAHPSPRHVHVLHYRQVISKFVTITIALPASSQPC